MWRSPSTHQVQTSNRWILALALLTLLAVPAAAEDVSVNLQDVVAALLGSLLFLVALRVWRWRRRA